MRSVQAHACLQRCGAEGGHSQSFATIYEINLVAGFIFLALFEGNIACSSQLFYSLRGKFALGFGCIQKFLIAFAVCKRCFLGNSVLLSDMGEFPCQILLQFLCSCHNLSLLVSTLVSSAKQHYVNNTTNSTIWGEEGKCIQDFNLRKLCYTHKRPALLQIPSAAFIISLTIKPKYYRLSLNLV